MSMIELDQTPTPEAEKDYFARHVGKNQLISKGGVILIGTAEQWARLIGDNPSMKYQLIHCPLRTPVETATLTEVYEEFYSTYEGSSDELGRS